MVRAVLVVLLLWAGTALAASAYRVDRRELALGEALTLTLNAHRDVLETLDLKPLERDFEIRARTLSYSGEEGSLSITLYPLRTGPLALPRLGLPGRPPSVRVDNGGDDVPKVRFRVETDPARPLVRQPTRLTVEVCDDGSLDWKRPALPTREGLYLRILGERQVEVERDGERCTALRWYWSLIPTAAGVTDLPLPMLQADKFGRRLRFPPPALALDVRPVPLWLPAEVAVGRPRVSSTPLPASWPLGRPLAWHLEIDGGYSPLDLRNLLKLELAGRPLLTTYPPSVDTLPFDGNVPTPRLAVTLYALPDHAGRLALPKLTLPWFDPADGELHDLALPVPRLVIVDPFYDRLRTAGMALLGIMVLIAAGWRLARSLRWRLARRNGLAAIAESDGVARLERQVRAFTLHPSRVPAPTLGAWQDRMATEARCEGIADLSAALNRACYGRGSIPARDIRNRALEILRHARPRRSPSSRSPRQA